MGHRLSTFSFIALFAFMATSSLMGRGLVAQDSTYTVSGKVIGGPPILRGRQGGPITISLNGSASRPVRPGIIEENPKRISLRARVESDGAFAFSNIPPGTYRLTTYVMSAEQQSIPTVVVTNRDVPGLKVTLVRDDVVTSRNNLELAWSLPGPWSGVAIAARDGAIYNGVPGDPVRLPPFATVAPVAHIREIDFSGKTLREIPTAGFGSTKIVLAHLSASNDPDFLLFEGFNDGVHALDRNGNLLWTHSAGRGGVYDVAVMESQGSAFDEVVVSYSGREGIHALNSRGDVLWKMKSESWDSPVSAGDVRGEGKPQVVTTSDAGHLQSSVVWERWSATSARAPHCA